ncbi:MAG: recombinase family protein [Oscillospiraceae bacterium]
MKIAAAYIRVSTEGQDEYSPDSQLKLIREYAKKHDFIVPNEYIFYDDGISAKSVKKRTQFNNMIAIAKEKSHPIDAILVWKFSRFARNQEESIVYKSLLKKNNVNVISISEYIDEDNPFGTLIERIIEWMDEYYLIRLSGEVKRGMLEKFSRGQVVNAPPIGYSLKDGNYVPDDNAPLIQRIFEMFANGKGYRSIANQLNAEGFRTMQGNKFENRTVEYILRNPTYIGKLRWTPGGKGSQSHYNNNSAEVMTVDGTHQPIIKQDLWDKVQDIVNSKKQSYPKYSRKDPVVNDFMLRGLVRCSNCGATLVYNKVYNALQCYKYAQGKCSISHYVSLDIINQSVLDGLRKALGESHINIEFRSIAPAKSKTDNINLLIKKEKEKLKRIKEAYVNGIDTIDEYKSNKSKIMSKIAELQKSIPEVKPQNTQTQINNLQQKIKDFLKLADDPNADQKSLNQSLREFISKIVYNKADKTVELYFYV